VRAAALALLLAADPRAQLEALRARRAAEEAAARQLGGRERSILEALAGAERAAAESASEAVRAEAARVEAEGVLARARREEAAAQERVAEHLAELAPRLRARQRLGHLGELRLLAASGSIAELARREVLLGRVLAHDLQVLAGARGALAESERARAAREADSQRLAALAAEAEARRAEAAARREEHRALLAAVRGALALHQRAAEELAAQGHKLAEFIAALPPPRAGVPVHAGFAALRGKLPRPADGPVAVGFGKVVDQRFKTVTVQKGIDIAAPAGSPVRAVAPGRVVHAGWFNGYGNLVIVDHGDGYHTLVAHLESMTTAMGEEVGAGTRLGTVGQTGSLKGAYLYFEIREQGRPVDPRSWLAR